ncbi:hypothetical protein H310_06881 [Aphanomyces invadans]|uniref:peptidylprolyl isomerase n=1 Tax=Aphanomyces invadans TaxID=157072 RepID=A0A024U6T1_9STRA|nr:hypothetical protein H310_06881 [Aphanomyces invadans]ETW01318.1 hypothetical protein H310_06881 [Aphanomyces invadans]|eukprot:XP_008870316.1 hypothetical protein H310_06881 [Aphanomyces invadans]
MLRRAVQTSRKAVQAACKKAAPIASMHVMARFHTCVPMARRGFMDTSASAGVRFMSSNATRPVKLGDQVSVLIEGRLSNGDIFDEKDTTPQKFIVGDSDVIPGLEEGLLGMVKGQTKVIIIPPELAFGPAGDTDNHVRIPKSELNLLPSEEADLQIGNYIGLDNEGDMAKIIDMDMDSIVVDTSHELAGETLHLSVELVGHTPLEELSPSERLVVPHEISPGDEETYPEPGDTLAVHYEGFLTDGTMFDSSRKRGKPFEFIIGSGLVIKGWDEGMLNMSKGEKARLYIPAAKGYGDHGAPPAIPPNADLIFEVELIQIKKRH